MYSDIYQPIQSKIYEKDNVTTPQPHYGGSHREANTGSDTLGALAATLYSRSFVLPDYARTTTSCTDRTAYVRRTYVRRTDCYCGQARLLLGYVLSYCLPSVVILTIACDFLKRILRISFGSLTSGAHPKIRRTENQELFVGF